KEYTLILFSIIFVSVILLITVLFSGAYHAKKLKNIIDSKNAELNQLRSSEEKLCHELNSLQTKLRNSIEDPVTQLQGWGLFEDRVNHCIQESARYQFTMAVLFVDINDFKIINHALGYETGDAVLNVVSQRLQSSIRQVDYV